MKKQGFLPLLFGWSLQQATRLRIERMREKPVWSIRFQIMQNLWEDPRGRRALNQDPNLETAPKSVSNYFQIVYNGFITFVPEHLELETISKNLLAQSRCWARNLNPQNTEVFTTQGIGFAGTSASDVAPAAS